MWRVLRTPTGTWLALVAITVAVWCLADGGFGGRYTVLLLMALAAFKVRLVFLNFMELRATEPPWRAIFEVWILACGAMIVAMAAWSTA